MKFAQMLISYQKAYEEQVSVHKRVVAEMLTADVVRQYLGGKEMTSAELADVLNRPVTSVAVALKRLEAEGYVYRSGKRVTLPFKPSVLWSFREEKEN
jgi:DNA-binding GntR family transcriptional regulator